MPRRKAEFSLSEMTDLVSQGLNQAVINPTINNYVPHDKQIQFHRSRKKGRLYIGGNRSGKTVGGIVEDIWRLRGSHPYQPVKPYPIIGRIVTVSLAEGIEMIIKPEIKKWILPSDLINGSWEDSYDKQLKTLTLANGSSVELMTYEQDLEKFAGTARDFVHFDEEPPKAIFTECKARLVSTAGNWYMTMTPVEGMTWIYDDIYVPGLKGDPRIDIVNVDITENPYLDEEEVDSFLSGLDKDEVAARKSGKFVQIGGLVYKKFDPVKHTMPPLLPPLSWTQYVSLDHGLNNPTCFLWHAVAPSGAVVTFDELYQNETLVDQFAAMVHERNSRPGRRPPDVYVADPAIKQRNAQTGDSIQTAYARLGIPFALGVNDVGLRVNKMNAYFKNGMWIITESCPNLITELQRVKWKIFESAKKRHDNNVREEIHKLHDHAPDSAGYFFSMMPELYIPPVDKGPGIIAENNRIKAALSAVTPQVGAIYDKNLSSGRSRTEWVDEHMGGEW